MKPITLTQAQQLLHIRDGRTLQALIADGVIETITQGHELYVDKARLLSTMGVADNSQEPFITRTEASQILHVNEPKLLQLTQEGQVPGYRLRDNRGAAYLYRRSELQALKQALAQESHSFYHNLRKREGERSLLELLLNSTAFMGQLFSPRQMQVLRLHLREGRTFTEIAYTLELTGQRVRQVYQAALAILSEQAANHLAELLADAENYRTKIATLELLTTALTDGKDPDLVHTLTRPITEYKLPVRALGCFAKAGITTLGQLITWPKSDLLKFNNFGRKTLAEVEHFLTLHGIKWHEQGTTDTCR